VIHLALTCVTDSAGQPICTDTSAGFFAGLGILLFIYIAIAVLGIVAAVKVVTKAGYSGWWVLICLVPLVGSVFVLIFAFSTWPITREVESLRAQLANRGGYGRAGGYGVGPDLGAGPGPTPSGQVPIIPTPAEEVSMPPFRQVVGEVTIRPDASGPGSVETTLATPQHPPAGWFPSPGGPPGQLRYWDGTGWSDQYR
jgi:hypothetical protein